MTGGKLWQRTRASTLRRRNGWVIAALVLATMLLVVSAAGIVAHYRSPSRGWMIGVSAFSPYLMLAAPIAVVVLVVSREWLAAVVALAVTVVAVVTQAPLYVSSDPPAHARTLRVMTANLRKGQASPASVVGAVRRHHVDALMLEELTPEEQARLQAAGLDSTLPFHVSDPRPTASGSGIWSRLPLSDAVKRTDLVNAFVTARVRVAGETDSPLLAVLHLPNAYPDSAGWLFDIKHLGTVLPGLGRDGTAVVGGDFNATPDLRQFRSLLTGGWSDAAGQAGAGMTRTYPSDTFGYPLIAIDHVLTRRAVATAVETLQIDGSDHRAFVATIAVPVG